MAPSCAAKCLVRAVLAAACGSWVGVHRGALLSAARRWAETEGQSGQLAQQLLVGTALPLPGTQPGQVWAAAARMALQRSPVGGARWVLPPGRRMPEGGGGAQQRAPSYLTPSR